MNPVGLCVAAVFYFSFLFLFIYIFLIGINNLRQKDDGVRKRIGIGVFFLLLPLDEVFFSSPSVGWGDRAVDRNSTCQTLR